MLATEKLLQALSNADLAEKHTGYSDYDFGKVLELYVEPDKANCEAICSDGQKRSLFLP